jgi:hypothetical protein
MSLTTFLSWLKEWASVVNIFSSLLLTGLLVLLYYQQHRLKKWEYNQDIRRRHTETLKERIRAWHGNIGSKNENTSNNPLQKSSNLPKVKRATVKPAPGGVDTGDQPFRAVPRELETDRYFDDLLQNHANDLRDLKKTIEQLYEDYEKSREEFKAAYDMPAPINEEDYKIEGTEWFSDWLFECMVRIHRPDVDISVDDVIDEIKTGIDGTYIGVPTDDYVSYAEHPGWPTKNMIRVKIGSIDPSKWDMIQPSVEEACAEFCIKEIESISDDQASIHYRQGGDALKNMDRRVEELRATLVEYEGDIHYAGDCEYIADSKF